MSDPNSELSSHLAEIDAGIQKLLWLQIASAVIYGVLFFEGLALKLETNALEYQIEATEQVLTKFSWKDSLAAVLAGKPAPLRQYRLELEQFQQACLALQSLTPQLPQYALVITALQETDSTWREMRSRQVFAAAQTLARRGKERAEKQLMALAALVQAQPLDSLAQALELHHTLAQTPAWLDTLRLLVEKINPAAVPVLDFSRWLQSLEASYQFPAVEDVESAITAAQRFINQNELAEATLSALARHRSALIDSMQAKDQQKGAVYLAVIDQQVPVRLAFYFGLPVLLLCNHLLLLFLERKARLHQELGIHAGAGIAFEASEADSLNAHLSPFFLNFLWMDGTSSRLRKITGWLAFALEIAVALLGLAIFWYLLRFLPPTSPSPVVALIVAAVLMLVNFVQVRQIWRTIRATGKQTEMTKPQNPNHKQISDSNFH